MTTDRRIVIVLLLLLLLALFMKANEEKPKEILDIKSTEATSAVLFKADDKQELEYTATTTTIPPTTTTTHYHPPSTTTTAPKPVATEPPRSGSVNWDAIAECESGGNWSINTGNGYYGGLQFDLQTWRGTGGTGYPHEHSREEQIHRAEILYASRGVSPWPSCGRYG